MKKSILAICFLIFVVCTIWSQNATNGKDERPSVALVLAGGGARGFTHIPIIELIEELGIPIDMVIGTSAGAIIGGLYSAGYSGEEIAQELLYLDWPTLFQDATIRPLEGATGSHSKETNLVNVQLTRDLSLDLGKGLLTGQYVYNRFKALTVKIPSYIHFDSLITPFRATAVDLLTGEMVVLEQGDLVEAIRASMSIPAVFEPFPINGRLYMDGFTRNNLPVQVAEDMGFDIIIAVEVTDKMSSDEESFDSTPFNAISQVMALQQSVIVSQEYELADLVLYPDIYEFGQMDYALAPQIYEKGKKEAEKYREELIAIRSKVFPNFNNAETIELIEEVENLTENGFSFTFVSDEPPAPYKRQNSYADLPKIAINDIVLDNALQSDERIILSEFEKIKGSPFGEKEIEALLSRAYKTGNYILVTARIDKRTEGNRLILSFTQKQRETVHLNTGATFEGSLSNASSWALNLNTILQLRELNDAGGLLSLKASLLNMSGIELLYMQPVAEKVFLQAKVNFQNTLDVTTSGFKESNVDGSEFREVNFALACGVFFNPVHKLFNEVGFRWIDANFSNSITEIDESLVSLKQGYAFDFSTRYTFSTVNYNMFTTKGFYNDLKVMGVFPIADASAPIIFDVISSDFVFAFPFSTISSLVVNSFVGTNISEGLNGEKELVTKYGFTTYDRTFFPHVTQRASYGIHKLALKVDFQFQPESQLTILGGQFFAGFGGAVGDVWDSYAQLSSIEQLKNIEWQASALTGLRIKDSVGLMLRAGAGSYDDGIAPFISLDFIAKHY